MNFDAQNQQTAQLSAVVDTALFRGQIAVVDANGILVAKNGDWETTRNHPILEALARVHVGENLSATCRTGTAETTAEADAFVRGFQDVLNGTVNTFRQEYVDSPQSPQCWFVVSVAPLLPTNQAIISLLDLTAIRHAEHALSAEAHRVQSVLEQLQIDWQRLESLVTLDYLTGLKNYRTLQEHLRLEWERIQRYLTNLSLLLLDIDHFKSYNDTFGHPAGNIALQHVAEALRATARESDFLARYGGEEFVIVLPNTDEIGAMAMAQRFQNSLTAVAWPKRPVTVSIGMASWKPGANDNATDPLRLLEHADMALYAAKVSGRNSIRHYSALAAPESAPEIEASKVESS